MIHRTMRLALALLPLVLLGGCVYDAVSLRAFKTPGVDRIPTQIGFFPFFSTSGQASTWNPYPVYGMRSGSALSIQKRHAQVDIVPPTGFSLAVTPESQMLTDLLTTDLTAKGFALQQLPVELQEVKDSAAKAAPLRGFHISLDLLSELGNKYGIQAVVLGDAFFTYDSYSRQTRVSLAHLKIVDIKTLKILAEVGTAYNSDGFDLNQITDQITDNLADLAGIRPIPQN
ncbi:MAG TPA: hypothetical protein VJ873_07325 [bacterium]|nr:hypothetical protein [bacterium]